MPTKTAEDNASLRMCQVCRSKGERLSLLRFVRGLDGEICFDEKAVLPTRGFWVCPKRLCLKRVFLKKQLFKEAYLPVDGEKMTEFVVERLKSSGLSRLGLTRKIGQCEAGRDAVVRLIQARKIFGVVLAKDVSPRTLKDLTEHAARHDVAVLLSPYSMLHLGQSIGRDKTGVVGLPKSRITEEIWQNINLVLQIEA